MSEEPLERSREAIDKAHDAADKVAETEPFGRDDAHDRPTDHGPDADEAGPEDARPGDGPSADGESGDRG